MKENHDPGDESNHGARDWDCPFCGRQLLYNNVHCFPIREGVDPDPFPFEAMPLTPQMKFYDMLETCTDPACMEKGRKFSRQSLKSTSRKAHEAYLRWRNYWRNRDAARP